MSNETMTAEQALGEAMDAMFGNYEEGWREVLARMDRDGVPDSTILNEIASVGFLRRWSAPLLAKEVDDG